MRWHDRASIPSEVLAEQMSYRNRELTLTVTVTNSPSSRSSGPTYRRTDGPESPMGPFGHTRSIEIVPLTSGLVRER